MEHIHLIEPLLGVLPGLLFLTLGMSLELAVAAAKRVLIPLMLIVLRPLLRQPAKSGQSGLRGKCVVFPSGLVAAHRCFARAR